MSSSQFDDLLGDFGGESSTTTTTTKTTSSSGANGALDDFDPFGPSDTTAAHGGGAGDMFMDFSVSETKNGGVDVSAHPSANPLYEQSANPLYDDFTVTTTSTAQSDNLLGDFSDEPAQQTSATEPPPPQSSNPLYDFSDDPPPATTGGSGGNPLYDEDFITGGGAPEPEPVNPLYEGFSSGGNGNAAAEDLVDMSNQGEESEEFVIEALPPQVMNGHPRDWFGEDYQQQHHQEEEEEPEIEAVQEPEVEQLVQEDEEDDAVVSSQVEESFSDAGLESRNVHTEQHTANEWEDSLNKQNAEKQTEQTVEEPVRNTSTSSSSKMAEPRDTRVGLDADDDDDDEEGVYENEPERRDDVVREADRDASVDVPAAGTAASMRARFLQDAESASAPSPRSKREITPPAHGSGGEYVSEPRTVLEHYEAKPDSGVFESPEPTRNPEVVSSYDQAEEAVPEQGYAKNLAARFKELESQAGTPSSGRPRREITPPSGEGGPTEYVSEPRGPGVEQHQAKVDAGVFESEPQVNPDVVHSGESAEEALPERGTARNMASRYLQLTEESKSPPSASSGRAQREMAVTSDSAARVEYESEPQRNPDVVTSETQVEEFVPQRGFAKNLASRFKELESTAKSPPQSPGNRHVKEFTPPREAEAPVVRESAPAEQDPEVVHSGEALQEALPEKGTARNMMARFKQLEADNRSPGGNTRAKKEFTPPPGDAGVYENTPRTFQADYNRPAESGIVENQPVQREDVIRGNEPPKYEEELPERGAAKSLVSKWRQIETEAKATKSPGSRPKEFTPPRELERPGHRKSPRTPMSPGGDAGGSNGSVHPSELPEQYQPQTSASVFESTPEQREDVLREGERDYAADLPKKNTAKKMLARFQSFQEKANQGGDGGATSPAASRQESSDNSIDSEPDPAMESARQVFENPDQVGRSKSMRAAVQVEKCGACDKTVYAMERLEMNKLVYHKGCFRCSQCKSVLTPKTFAINNGVIFCTNHYKQLFATKGNYDEGFGRMQHKKRWNSNPNLADGEEENNSSSSSSNNRHNGHHQQQQQQHTVAAANS